MVPAKPVRAPQGRFVSSSASRRADLSTRFQSVLSGLDPSLKLIIPLTVCLALVTVAAIRIHSLNQEYTLADREARLNLATLALATAKSLNTLESLPAHTSATALFRSLLPDSATQNGRRFFVINEDGSVAAFVAEADIMADTKPFENFSEHVGANAPLTVMGAKAGVIAIQSMSGEPLYATLHHLEGPFHALAITQAKTQALASWYAGRNQDILIFVTMALLSITLVYSYFSQSSRNDALAKLYHQAYQRQEIALRHGHSGLWDWYIDDDDMVWSCSMCHILGRSQAHDSGQLRVPLEELKQLVHPDDINLDQLKNLLLTTNELHFDQRLRAQHNDGSWVWLRLRGELLAHPNGGRQLIGIATDITEQQKLEEKTRQADLRLRDAIETISEAFVLWDHENKLVLCNSKYQKLHKLSAKDVMPGMRYGDVVAKSRPHMTLASIQDNDPQRPQGRTYEVTLPKGRWLQVSERRTQDGGYVSVGTDITEIKRHEGKLMEKEKRLIDLVKDLKHSQKRLETQAHQLKQLAEKYASEKEKAEAANHAKSEFLANISHELRTPLNAVIGFSDMMRAETLGPLGSAKYHEYCQDIHESGTFLLSIIEDILEMSHLEADHIKLQTESMDLDKITRHVLERVKSDAAAKNITVGYACAGSTKLIGDKQAMDKILFNVISNAIKFTPEGGQVDCEIRDQKSNISITISDTGIGIAPENLQKLGQPFEQVQSQLTKSHPGSGLGLAITQKLVALHGGKMRITSEEGQGTRVTLTLPRDQGMSGDTPDLFQAA